MKRQEIKEEQKKEQGRCLDEILKSTAPKKMIISGPGTGKTFTFCQLLKRNATGRNLALTFIRKLRADMEKKLGEYAEVKTFHSYCKKILHERNDRVGLIPYLTKIVEMDAELLGKSLSNFNAKMQMLDENCQEVAFYLSRGYYYDVISFDDSVYRLYKLMKDDPDIIPYYDQIVIDEFQDFNPLEVAFISELEKKGPILIVGDDDQAVYDGRCASPKHLREWYNSGNFELFELPFCYRCPEAIINATKSVIKRAQALGKLMERVEKKFECYFAAKENDSIKYPKIIVAQCSVVKVVGRYIQEEISKIDQEDIADSYKEGKEYPTVLIIGQKQYLRELEKFLKGIYPQLSYLPSKETEYGVNEGYELILEEEKSNLGWRILIEFFCDLKEQRRILSLSDKATKIFDLLDRDFTVTHFRVVEIIEIIKSGEQYALNLLTELQDIVGNFSDQLIMHFAPEEKSEELAKDKTQPTILLTSYIGCKGLSGGHVFIVGANNGSIPKNLNHIRDVEVSQFIVSLTRTRKRCHIISNKWFVAPINKRGEYIPPNVRSIFVSWLSKDIIEDRGYLEAENLNKPDK